MTRDPQSAGQAAVLHGGLAGCPLRAGWPSVVDPSGVARPPSAAPGWPFPGWPGPRRPLRGGPFRAYRLYLLGYSIDGSLMLSGGGLLPQRWNPDAVGTALKFQRCSWLALR